MRSLAWNERGQALEEDERLEDDVRSSIAPRPAKAVQDVAVLGEREALCRDGGAGDIPAQVLEPIAIAGGDAHARVEREAVDLGTELAGHVGDLAVGSRADPREGPTGSFTERDAARDGGGGERVERRRLRVGVGPCVAHEQAQHAVQGLVRQSLATSSSVGASSAWKTGSAQGDSQVKTPSSTSAWK